MVIELKQFPSSSLVVRPMYRKLFTISSMVVALCLCGTLGLADDKDKDKDKKDGEQRETVSKPLTEKQRKKKEAKLRKELETPYKKWLNEDVGYIITDEERKSFSRLSTDE